MESALTMMVPDAPLVNCVTCQAWPLHGALVSQPWMGVVALDEDQLVGPADRVAAGRSRGPRRAAVVAEVEGELRIHAISGAADGPLQGEHGVAAGVAGLAGQVERLHPPLLREESGHHHADHHDGHRRAHQELDQRHAPLRSHWLNSVGSYLKKLVVTCRYPPRPGSNQRTTTCTSLPCTWPVPPRSMLKTFQYRQKIFCVAP